MGDQPFTDWEAILSEIITGDSFGVDRIDYLLRDSYHLGVSYGKFDHLKLIESLRVLPKSLNDDGSREPALGIEAGGLHSAEALLLARYFMYEQVYFHHVRRIYDHHLIQFMKEIYGENGYNSDVIFHLKQTDNAVMTAVEQSLGEDSTKGAIASRILDRRHFRQVYERNPSDDESVQHAIAEGRIDPGVDRSDLSAASFIYDVCKEKFPSDLLFYDAYTQKSNPALFPVLMPDGRVEESTAVSLILREMPVTDVRYIFAAPEISDKVASWIVHNLDGLLKGSGHD